jgi:hypothetical protein
MYAETVITADEIERKATLTELGQACPSRPPDPTFEQQTAEDGIDIVNDSS